MTLKNFKLKILFSGFLFLFSINSNGQYLRNHMISTDVYGGFLQQKTNFSYQYSPGRFITSKEDKFNQLFFGVGIGATRLESNVSTFMNKGIFHMSATGTHLSFMITHVISQPKERKKHKFKYKYTTLKCAINNFNKVKSYPAFDTYDEDDDFNPPEKRWITGEKTRSVDIELHFAKHIKLNSYNFLKAAIYCGVRIGNTTGIKHSMEKEYYPNSTRYFEVEKEEKYYKSLNPVILGFSLGYQINFGKQNLIKIK